MTVLVAGGDSFTYGNELADCTPEQPSELTWSAFLAHKLGMKYMCVANGGWGNDAIARNVISNVYKLLQLDSKPVVAVMWSFPTRYEFTFNYNTLGRNSPWETINPWTHEKDQKVILDAFKNFMQTNLDDYRKHQLQAQSTGLAEFSELFFKHVGSNTTYSIYNSYRSIVHLQNWLQQNGIKYVFTYVDDMLFTQPPDDQSVNALYNSIEHSNIYHFSGFYNWAADNDYPFYSTHPCESAHTDFINKFFYPFVDQKFK